MTISSNLDRAEKLEKVIQLTFWMARRYANGRQTYAPDMVKEAQEILDELEIEIKEDKTLK